MDTQRTVDRAYAAGDVLYEQGTREAPFIVLRSGRVEFFDRGPDGDRYVATLLPGTFIGDLDVFTGEPTLVACVAVEDCRALVMTREDLRRLTADRPDVADLLLTTMIARRDWLEGNGYGQCRVLGTRWSREAFEIRELLGRNLVPYRWVDLAARSGDAAAEGEALLLEALGVSAADLPVLVEGMSVLRRPDLEAVASHFGLRAHVDGSSWDVAVVGAGPAGLAAAVYSASEGLSTVVLDAFAPGGQAGTSSRIENYLGFPTGVSGSELTRRAVLQARRFGALVSSCHDVVRVQRVDPARPGSGFRLDLSDGQALTARVVVVATGATYRRLDAEGADRFDGAGVYYAASHTEAVQCAGEEAVVVGGGNSAGQAALHLARYATRVHVVVRGDDLGATMSAYLVDRLGAHPRITVWLRTRLTAFRGHDGLDGATAETVDPDGRTRTWPIPTAAPARGRSPPTQCSCSSAPLPAATRCETWSRPTAPASCWPAPTPLSTWPGTQAPPILMARRTTSRGCWRPPSRGCWPSVTFALGPRSVSPPPSVIAIRRDPSWAVPG